MTHAAAAPDDNRPLDRVLFRLAHYQVAVLLAMAALYVADYYVKRPPPLDAAVLAVYLTLLVVFVVQIYAAYRHARGICLACGEDFPLDAPGQAEGKRRPALRAFHLFNDKPHWTLPAQAALIVGSFWWWWVSPSLFLVWGAHAWASRWHRILEPYCPYCRDDGPGDDEAIDPSPVPAPGGVG